MPDDADIGALREALREKKVLVVCGAGVSVASTKGQAPGWRNLIEKAVHSHDDPAESDWKESCFTQLKSTDVALWLSAADMAQRKLGGVDSQKYRAFLKEAIGTLRPIERRLPEAISALSVPICTTNYDEVLTSSLGKQPKTWQNPEAVAEIIKGESTHIWHVHGYWEEPASVIFSQADYTRVASNERAQFLQQVAAFDRTLLFIGCSADGLADKNIGKLLEWFGDWWTGLGKTHYALVKEDVLSAPGWPESVRRISFGKNYDDLPKFIEQLAEYQSGGSVNKSAIQDEPYRSIENVLGKPVTVGRIAEISSVVEAALAGIPSIIVGAPGMGKSTVAIASAYDPQIIGKFGSKRILVNLEGKNAALDLLISISFQMGLKSENSLESCLAAIRYNCSHFSTLLILDNIEEIIENDAAEAKRILGLLRDIHGLSYVVTSRTQLPGLVGWRKIDDLVPLSYEEARDLFCSIATSISPDDNDLLALLTALDGHALSIILVAGQAEGDPNARRILERWQLEKAKILRTPGTPEDRLSSVRASLRLSLNSKLVTPLAGRLLAVLGALPGGLPPGGLKEFLGREDLQITREKSDEATDILRRLRLLPQRVDGRLKLLNPLREALVHEKPLKSPDFERVTRVGAKVLSHVESLGTLKWLNKKLNVEQNHDNIPAFIRLCCKSNYNLGRILTSSGISNYVIYIKSIGINFWLDIENLLKSINPKNAESFRAYAMMSHSYQLMAYSSFDKAWIASKTALDLFTCAKNDSGAASALLSIGDIARIQGDIPEAKKMFDEALAIYERIGNGSGEANVRYFIGVLARLRNDLPEAGSQYAKALTIQERIGNASGEANTRYCLGDLALHQYDFPEARSQFNKALTVYERIGDALGEANTRHSLGALALRQDDLPEAGSRLNEALTIYMRIGRALGEANTRHSLGDLALRQNDLHEARSHFDKALTLRERTGEALGQANSIYSLGKFEIHAKRASEAEGLITQAFECYAAISEEWGMAHAGLRLAQIASARGNFEKMPDAVRVLLKYETSDPGKKAGAGWSAFCASLTETDFSNRAALEETARAEWTRIGALGLVREYLDFRPERLLAVGS